MNKDVACTNRMHVQLDLARRKLHWASLTMDIQERQKSFQNTDFSETQKDSDEVSPLSEKGMFCMLSAIFYGLFNPDRLI